MICDSDTSDELLTSEGLLEVTNVTCDVTKYDDADIKVCHTDFSVNRDAHVFLVLDLSEDTIRTRGHKYKLVQNR